MPRTLRRPVKALRAKSVQRKTRGQAAGTSKASPVKSAAKNASGAKSSREKVRAHRERMRARGLRLVQIWLPDTRTPEFKERAHRDSLAIAKSATEAEDQAFIDSVSWWTSEEAEALWRTEPEGWWKEPED